MFRKQSFWKGSALLLASAMTAKLLGACFKIPLTNVLGGTGMGYFSTAYGLLLPVYALSVTGLSAAVAQTVSRAAALEHWSEVRRIHHAARLACGALGLLLSLCMFLLAEPFATQIAAQPHALFSLLAIAPAALFGCLTAVERGYWEGLQNMTPTALSQALEAVAKLGFGLALCMWVLRNPEVVCRWVPPEVPLSALAAAGAVLGVTLSTVLGWVYFLLHGLRRDTRLPRDDRPAAPVSPDFPAAALRNDSGGTGLAGDEPDLSAGSGDHDALPWTGADVPRGRTGGEIRGICRPAGFSGICLRLFHRHGDHCVQSGALCHQHAGEKCSALCGGTVGEAGLPWHSGTCSLCHRSRGGDGVSGGRRAVGAGGAGDASALRRQTGRSCHCRRSPPDTAPRHGLPVPDISLCAVCYRASAGAGIPVLCMLAGVAVKLAGNLLLLSRPAFCITGAGIATSACYLVLLLILWQLHRCLGVQLHLLRGLFPPAAAAACCTGAAWFCHTYAQPLGMLLSAAAASGVGCLVYLAVWGLLMRCRKRKALI